MENKLCEYKKLPGLRPRYKQYVEVILSLLIKHWIGESLGPGWYKQKGSAHKKKIQK